MKVAIEHDRRGVMLVVTDDHEGLKNAVKAILPFAAWQRCRVHVARNVTRALGAANAKPINALIGTVFSQNTAEAVTTCDKHATGSQRDSGFDCWHAPRIWLGEGAGPVYIELVRNQHFGEGTRSLVDPTKPDSRAAVSVASPYICCPLPSR